MVSKRLDSKRISNQLRDLNAKVSILKYTDGSGEFCIGGKWKVLCSVNGPTSVRHRNEYYDKSYLSVKFENLKYPSNSDGTERRSAHGPRETQIELIIKGCLEKVILTETMPLTAVEVTCQLMGEDCSLKVLADKTGTSSATNFNSIGSLYSVIAASINASFLALADAGVPMEQSLCAFVVADSLLDPTEEEYTQAESLHLVIVGSGTFNQPQIIGQYSQGAFDFKIISSAHCLCIEKAGELFKFMANVLNK